MEFSQPPPQINNGPDGGELGGGGGAMPPSGASGPPRPEGHENHHRGGFFNNHRGHYGRGHHHGGDGGHRHHHPGGVGAGTPGQPFFRPFVNFARGPGGLPMTQDDFDGKRLRKSVMRKTVDYNASIIRSLQVKYDYYFIHQNLYRIENILIISLILCKYALSFHCLPS